MGLWDIIHAILDYLLSLARIVGKIQTKALGTILTHARRFITARSDG